MDGDPANFNSKLLKPFAKFFLSKEQRMRKIEDETEKEILMLIDEGEEKGVIEESQREMITNIFEFDDMLASDVMTHRTEIEAIEINDEISQVV